MNTNENIVIDAETFDESMGFEFEKGDLVELIACNASGIVLSREEDEIIRIRCEPGLREVFKHTKIKKALFSVLISTGEIIEEYGEYIRKM